MPERISARVASKPRKTYAEDDVPMDDEDRREVFVGAPLLGAHLDCVLLADTTLIQGVWLRTAASASTTRGGIACRVRCS